MADQGLYTATNLPQDGETIDAADVNTDLQGLIDEFNKNVGESKITDQAVSTVKIKNESWTPYSPTFTSAGGDASIGNGTIVGRYMKVGKTYTVTGRMVWGSTTNGGTGTLRISLPATSADNDSLTHLGGAWVEDNGTLLYNSICRVPSGADYVVFYVEPDTTALSDTSVFTLSSNDKIEFTVIFEAA